MSFWEDLTSKASEALKKAAGKQVEKLSAGGGGSGGSSLPGLGGGSSPLPSLTLNTTQTAGPSNAAASLGGYGVVQGKNMVVNMGGAKGGQWLAVGFIGLAAVFAMTSKK